MWTVLLTNTDRLRSNAQYLPVPNEVYAHMKGDYDAEPFAKQNDEKIGDLWEAYGTLLFLGNSTPAWKGLRTIIYRAMISYGKLRSNGEDESWIARAKAWGPDIQNWDEVFEAARAKAYGCYEDESDKEEKVELPEEENSSPPPEMAPPTGVWDEGEAAHDDADFDVDDDEEKENEAVDDEEDERRRVEAEEEAKKEYEAEELRRKEALVRESERGKFLTEGYRVKKEESDGERRSRPRRSSTAEDADGNAGGGGETFVALGGAQSPAKAESDIAREETRADAKPTMGVDEIVEGLLDDLRRLPERGRHPYVMRRTRHVLTPTEVAAAPSPSDVKPMFGDRMSTMLSGSRFNPDEIGRYVGSLLELDNQKLFTIIDCPGCLLQVVELMEMTDEIKYPKAKLHPAAGATRRY